MAFIPFGSTTGPAGLAGVLGGANAAAQQQPQLDPFVQQTIIDRRRRLAEILAQTAQSQQPQSAVGAAGNLLNQFAGLRSDAQASRAEKNNAAIRQQALSQFLSNPDAGRGPLINSQDPQLQQLAAQRIFDQRDESRVRAREDEVAARRRKQDVEDRARLETFTESQRLAAAGTRAAEREDTQAFSAEQRELDRQATLEAATAKKAAKVEEKTASREEALNVWKVARNGLISALSETQTGPIVGRLPAVTSEQQTAEGAVAAVAPVLKQIFRAAGEGVFTDRDQQLLLDMAPTRTDQPAARAAKIENIDAIISAKLGVAPAAPDIPEGAIQLLRSNPALAADFDEKYGPGAAERVLNGG